MAAKKVTRDRFYVGQTVQLAMTKETGWAAANGAYGVIVTQRREGTWGCGSPFGAPVPGPTCTGARYELRTQWGLHNFAESMLPPIYDGEKLSTWEKFRKTTGRRLDRVVASRHAPRQQENFVELPSGERVRRKVYEQVVRAELAVQEARRARKGG